MNEMSAYEMDGKKLHVEPVKVNLKAERYGPPPSQMEWNPKYVPYFPPVSEIFARNLFIIGYYSFSNIYSTRKLPAVSVLISLWVLTTFSSRCLLPRMHQILGDRITLILNS